MQKKTRKSAPEISQDGPIGARTVRNVCVYCGSGKGNNPAYVAAAEVLGRALAEAGIGLVYGGGGLGLMGTVARATIEAGGRVTGIIPEFLTSREMMLRDVDELIVTSDMHQRKALMFERSDAFVALPGGIGTLEELFETWTAGYLGMHEKPVVLLDPTGHYDGLRAWLASLVETGYVAQGALDRLIVVDEVEAALELCAGA